jgi:hypothetical protein
MHRNSAPISGGRNERSTADASKSEQALQKNKIRATVIERPCVVPYASLSTPLDAYQLAKIPPVDWMASGVDLDKSSPSQYWGCTYPATSMYAQYASRSRQSGACMRSEGKPWTYEFIAPLWQKQVWARRVEEEKERS